MNKVKSIHEARAIFDLLGIKDVTKDWQSKQGTQVFELPFKTMYAGGQQEINRFSIYKSGYVRKMLVNSKGASWCCYQLNRTRTVDEYLKDYNYEGEWTGKYRKSKRKERIMIDTHEDRYVYLCNYILKNYYKKQTGASFYRVNDYQIKLMDMYRSEYWKNEKSNQLPFEDDQLPFVNRAVNRILEDNIDEDDKFFSSTDDVQVIINGHRYNLS
jgi:hypothetical protein